MIWRLRLHRIRRIRSRLLDVLGLACLVLMLLSLATALLVPSLLEQGAMLLAMGLGAAGCGVHYALAGESPSVQEYAEGDGRELPGVAKLASGLVASLGGVSMIVLGLMRGLL